MFTLVQGPASHWTEQSMTSYTNVYLSPGPGLPLDWAVYDAAELSWPGRGLRTLWLWQLDDVLLPMGNLEIIHWIYYSLDLFLRNLSLGTIYTCSLFHTVTYCFIQKMARHYEMGRRGLVFLVFVNVLYLDIYSSAQKLTKQIMLKLYSSVIYLI